ncbi:ankyrin repeat and LEM domain-containing protein 1 [Bicyclus anynana]|uniref:Ankyrin repeat and LEM domain-containing protein 1 n=1 Tax=Bicyclus anynana TaxID=110368 RepID=A0A6J1MXC6_BICAN|nr:ankyrin repeat and LEM domain-containing protein 1 [Bicyclus anynana]
MGTTYRELFKLYDLIQNGDARSVERFFAENKIDLNVILPCKGIGVLHLAVGIENYDKSKQCTELILKNGGDPNLSNDDGITPVHIAAIWGKVDNMKLLIGCGGDPLKADYDGVSAFDYAVQEQQWEVYDYLHNVVDQSDDSMGSPCAYTLDLERILVTTDQLVAEYEPVVENPTNNVSNNRKSEMIRDWCDKNSLVINKLYPTILGDTYLIENESVPWKDSDFTKTNDLNDTDITFRKCLSKRGSEVEISGIYPLEQTLEKNHGCIKDIKRKQSIYENFSLPGSPNSITHINYNTKSSLKKGTLTDSYCSELNKLIDRSSLLTEESKVDLDKALTKNSRKHKSDASICSELNKLAIDRSSLLTEESVELDRALAVHQNRTNEWLSSCGDEVKPGNTRRSSASSGVSSSFSGSIVLANVEEEYKYEDKEEDVVLIEKRLLVSSIVLPVDEATDAVDQTIISMASSLPSSMEYDVNTLRLELIRLGFTPGPIQEHNKTLYLKKLKNLKKNPIVVQRNGKTYSVELEKSLRSDEWFRDLTPYIDLENKARADFANPSKKWREGNSKTSFTYLLLDPRLTNNLPSKCAKQKPLDSWVTFINSIFYVGKGKRSRPYSHLYQALTLWKSGFKTSKDKKIQHILDIWSDKVGVICLHVFQNVIPAEAFTYEAAMIDVIGITNLKNLKSGNYYGVASSWPLKERRMLGLHLLYKAMQIFFNEGERQLRPDDID